MGDAMAIDGKGQKKFVYLRNWKASPNEPPVALASKDKKVKGTVEENVDFAPGGGSSDDCSEEERVVDEEQDDRRNLGRINLGIGSTAGCEVNDSYLEQFKYASQEILVSYSCQIFLGCFELIYQQRYKKPLNYQKLGIEKLEELFEKVRDVAVMQVDPVSKKKFLATVDG
ncbi:hypothetical protein SLE2022_261100 [Rubroshorea leprosula]